MASRPWPIATTLRALGASGQKGREGDEPKVPGICGQSTHTPLEFWACRPGWLVACSRYELSIESEYTRLTKLLPGVIAHEPKPLCGPTTAPKQNASVRNSHPPSLENSNNYGTHHPVLPLRPTRPNPDISQS